MGVSGCGKTTVGKLLALRLGLDFFDADDFHPSENVEKMKNGIPLDDQDRQGWLTSINEFCKKITSTSSTVFACSALKSKYRATLSENINAKWICLEGSYDQIKERLSQRKGHYMAPGLLKSQFKTLEVPKSAFTVSINYNPEAIVDKILMEISGENK